MTRPVFFFQWQYPSYLNSPRIFVVPRLTDITWVIPCYHQSIKWRFSTLLAFILPFSFVALKRPTGYVSWSFFCWANSHHGKLLASLWSIKKLFEHFLKTAATKRSKEWTYRLSILLRISPNCGNVSKIRIPFTPTNIDSHTHYYNVLWLCR